MKHGHHRPYAHRVQSAPGSHEAAGHEEYPEKFIHKKSANVKNEKTSTAKKNQTREAR